jgi:2-polyprenyl-3-methyl-5-hydroxy-6-metoxy-1,4-benzoquinol methylase
MHPKVKRYAKHAWCFVRTGYWPTGERVDPEVADDNFINHFKVYKFIAQIARGRRVLDIGCGTGYGTDYLRQMGAQAVGIDIAKTAVSYAQRQYPEVRFAMMDAQKLEFPAASFDLVVSTENFEHLHDQAGHIREVRRVLARGGIAFIATPNPEMFLDAPHNPYHTHEAAFAELKAMLAAVFSEVVILENQSVPSSERGRQLRSARHAKGEIGILPESSFEIFGHHLETTHLSNTHSFMTFSR